MRDIKYESDTRPSLRHVHSCVYLPTNCLAASRYENELFSRRYARWCLSLLVKLLFLYGHIRLLREPVKALRFRL